MAEEEAPNAPDAGASESSPEIPSAAPASTSPAPDAPPVPETLAEKLGTLPPALPEKQSEPSIFYQFVIFPLLIVFVAVAIVGFFRWVASDRRTYDDYLTEISSGWKRKRPEAAYQLQFRIADKEDELRKSADVPKTIAVFEAAKKDRAEDPGIRRYLAIVLGHLGDASAVPALLEAASSDEPDQETRLNATWALGRCHDVRALPALSGLLEDPFEGVRLTAANALGELGDKSAADALAKRLTAPGEEIDVRWNAALSLARLGDARAVPTLVSMLDRKLLDSVQGKKDADHTPMTDKQREEVMINALRGVLALKATSALERVSAVADGDPDLKVREAAMEVRDQLKEALEKAPPQH